MDDIIFMLGAALIYCTVCHETDPEVLVLCRDGITRCAHHATEAGYCWDCGEGEPQDYGDDWEDGLCHDCHSETVMQERALKRIGW